MIWTKKERQEFFDRDPIAFAERAHEFACCDIPTLSDCLNCKIKPVACDNKADIEEVWNDYKLQP
jgi:hypothetical protein